MKAPLFCLFACLALSTGACNVAKKRYDERGVVGDQAAGAQGNEIKLSFDLGAVGLGLSAAVVTDLEVALTCDGFPAAGEPVETKIVQPLEFLSLYGEPTGCKLKLRAFKLDGKRFAPKSGKDFTSFDVGDGATFVDETGLNDLDLKVVTQLASPLVTDSLVKYHFSQLIADDDVFIDGFDINVTDGATVLDGEPAPDLYLKGAAFSLNNPTAVNLSLRLACLKQLTGATFEELKCGNDYVKDLEFILNPADTETITLAYLKAAFALADNVRLFDDVQIFVHPTEGIVLKLPVSLTTLGAADPSDLSDKVLLFAVRRTGGISFRYNFIRFGTIEEKKKSCIHSLKNGKWHLIQHGETYTDKTRPYYPSKTMPQCVPSGWLQFTCNDGVSNVPAVPNGSYSSCTSCSPSPNQSPSQNPVQSPGCY